MRSPVLSEATPGASGANAQWWRWLGVSLAVIVADYLTKAAILAAFRPGEQLALTGFFSLVLAFNTGAAFSFLAAADGWQRWLFAAIAVVASGVLVWLLRRGGAALFCLGLALILGGALGNLADRLIHGHVVDFLMLHFGNRTLFVFNLADAALTLGPLLLVALYFRPARKRPVD